MKLNLKALTLALVLGTVTTAATVRVFAQDEKTQQTEKQDEKKPDEKKEEERSLELTQWFTVPETKVKIGFVKGWELSGIKVKQAASPDTMVRFAAYVSPYATAKETFEHLKEDLEKHYTDLELTDPTEERECNELKVIGTGGHGKQQDGRTVNVAVDLIEDDGKVVIVEMVASHEHMEKYQLDILVSQHSYQKEKE